MFKFKFSYAVVLMTISTATLAAVFDKSSEQLDSLELHKIEPLSSEEAALKPKANWQPICQEVLVNVLEAQPVVPESEVVFLPQEIPGIVISPGRKESADACIAPNGGGITTFLRKAYELLPHERLNAIKNEAAKDPEVQKFASFINSASFRSQLQALIKTNAFVVFRDYACHMLYLNIDELMQFGGTVLDFEKTLNINFESRSNNVGGMLGLLSNIKNALPMDEFLLLLKQQLAQDEYLRKAKDLMKSPEFIAIAKAVEDQPEYVALMKALRENGFQFDVIVEYARKIEKSECGGL